MGGRRRGSAQCRQAHRSPKFIFLSSDGIDSGLPASLHAKYRCCRSSQLQKTQKTSKVARAPRPPPLSLPNLKTMMRRENTASTHQNYPQFSTFASFSPLLRLGRSQKLSPRTRPRVSRFPFFATTRRAFVSSSPSPSSHVCCCCREERHHHHYRATRAGFSASSEFPRARELCFDEDFFFKTKTKQK